MTALHDNTSVLVINSEAFEVLQNISIKQREEEKVKKNTVQEDSVVILLERVAFADYTEESEEDSLDLHDVFMSKEAETSSCFAYAAVEKAGKSDLPHCRRCTCYV